jgi:hypothetical protein
MSRALLRRSNLPNREGASFLLPTARQHFLVTTHYQCNFIEHLAIYDMSSSLINPDSVPRYIRYKAKNKRGSNYWDAELERVNTIVHERVQRMQRDKLCTGCARFDLIRTQFYSREAVRKDGTSPLRWNVFTLDQQRWVNIEDLVYVQNDLASLQDNVTWPDFEPACEDSRDALELMKHPRFSWAIDTSQDQPCILCRSLMSLGKASHPMPRTIKHLDIKCAAGPLLENGKGHGCLTVSSLNSISL